MKQKHKGNLWGFFEDVKGLNNIESKILWVKADDVLAFEQEDNRNSQGKTKRKAARLR